MSCTFEPMIQPHDIDQQIYLFWQSIDHNKDAHYQVKSGSEINFLIQAPTGDQV